MREHHFGLNILWRRLAHHSPRKVATTSVLGALAVMLVAGAGAPAVMGVPHGERHGHHEQDDSARAQRKGNKTVAKTFANGQAVEVPAAGSTLNAGPADPYPTTIVVTGFKRARITDINMTLRGLSHTFPADLDVLLVAPGGRNAVVMEEVGKVVVGASVTDLTLTLDDEAAAAIPTGNVLTSGSFRPFADDLNALDFPVPAPTPIGSVALSTFDGINPNGEWQLFILDDAQGDAGSLADGWSIEITAKAKAKDKGKGKKKH